MLRRRSITVLLFAAVTALIAYVIVETGGESENSYLEPSSGPTAGDLESNDLPRRRDDGLVERDKDRPSTLPSVVVAPVAETQSGHPEESDRAVCGRVLDLDDRPLPGAEVYLSEHFWNESDSAVQRGFGRPIERPRVASTTSAADGGFRIPLAEPGRFIVTAKKKGYGLRSIGRRPLPDGERLVFRLPRLEPLIGRVVDESGEPKAGFEVTSYLPIGTSVSGNTEHFEEARTGADGGFRTFVSDRIDDFRVSVRDPSTNVVQSYFASDRTADATGTVTLIWRGGRAVTVLFEPERGILLDRPIRFCLSIDAGRTWMAYATTGPDFRATIVDVPKTKTLRVAASVEGCAVIADRSLKTSSLRSVVDGIPIDVPEKDDCTIVLPVGPAARMNGRVLEIGSRLPVPYLTLEMRTTDLVDGHKTVRTATTTADGAFEFGGCPEGVFRIGIVGTAWILKRDPSEKNDISTRAAVAGVVVPSNAQPSSRIQTSDFERSEAIGLLLSRAPLDGATLFVERPAAIAGRVLTRDQNPVSGAVVTFSQTVELSRAGFFSETPSNETTTDAEGRFRFDCLVPESPITLIVRRRGIGTVMTDPIVVKSGEVRDETIEVTPSRPISVTVLDPGGLPVAERTVWIGASRADPWIVHRTRVNASGTTNAAGRVEFDAPPPGRFSIRVDLDAVDLVVVDEHLLRDIDPAETPDVIVRTKRSERFEAEFLHEDGTPAAGLEVQFIPRRIDREDFLFAKSRWPGRSWNLQDIGDYRSVRDEARILEKTDAKGKIAVKIAKPREFRLVARRRGSPPTDDERRRGGDFLSFRREEFACSPPVVRVANDRIVVGVRSLGMRMPADVLNRMRADDRARLEREFPEIIPQRK